MFPFVPSPLFKISQNKCRLKKMIATDGTVGLAEGIIDDTICLVLVKYFKQKLTFIFKLTANFYSFPLQALHFYSFPSEMFQFFHHASLFFFFLSTSVFSVLLRISLQWRFERNACYIAKFFSVLKRST